MGERYNHVATLQEQRYFALTEISNFNDDNPLIGNKVTFQFPFLFYYPGKSTKMLTNPGYIESRSIKISKTSAAIRFIKNEVEISTSEGRDAQKNIYLDAINDYITATYDLLVHFYPKLATGPRPEVNEINNFLETLELYEIFAILAKIEQIEMSYIQRMLELRRKTRAGKKAFILTKTKDEAGNVLEREERADKLVAQFALRAIKTLTRKQNIYEK